MTKLNAYARLVREALRGMGVSLALALLAAVLIYRYADPAPPRHLVISAGNGEGNFVAIAEQYRDLLKEDGVELEIRGSSGAMENLKRLEDRHSDVQAGFVQDGVGSTDTAPDVSSLGSLYYEPLWFFYQGRAEYSRVAQIRGKRVAIGTRGEGTRVLAFRLLKESGVTPQNTSFVSLALKDAAEALRKGQVDVAIFMGTADDELIHSLGQDPAIKLMSLEQAEATARRNPYLHHLVLPRGAFNLERGIPAHDVDLVAPTATLLVRDSLHPALVYLLLKAASQVHSGPGVLERRGEFPSGKDDSFPLTEDAERFYKSGTPFWQRHLPFWLATLAERFIIFVVPALALLLPAIRTVPKFMEWRVKSRIYQRYGELKFLEGQIRSGLTPEGYRELLKRLDEIEQRVNHTKAPLDFSDHFYILREHIELVRRRLDRELAT